MLCQNCTVVEQQLNGSTVFRRVPETKIWRRDGKMLAYAPDSGGSAVIEEAEQTLFRKLSTPCALAELVTGDKEQTVACLRRWHRQGVVQMLGKVETYPGTPEASLQVRWVGTAAQESLASLPEAVEQALAPRSLGLDWNKAEQTDWNSWSAQVSEPTRVLEATVTSAAAVDELAEVWQRSQAMNWQRLLIHAYLDKDVCAALLRFLKPGMAEAIPAEVMAYCPVTAWEDCKPGIGCLLRAGVACLPVGCLEDAGQLNVWMDRLLAARFRTIGVCQRSLLQGDVLRNKDSLSALARAWVAVMDRVEEFHREHEVRLRVYPLERLLLALIGAKSGVHRCEVQLLDAGRLGWIRHKSQERACARCWARTACSQLEDLEVGNVNCWLRKAVAEELLWRWHAAPECWQDVFRRDMALS